MVGIPRQQRRGGAAILQGPQSKYGELIDIIRNVFCPVQGGLCLLVGHWEGKSRLDLSEKGKEFDDTLCCGHLATNIEGIYITIYCQAPASGWYTWCLGSGTYHVSHRTRASLLRGCRSFEHQVVRVSKALGSCVGLVSAWLYSDSVNTKLW